MNMSSVVPIPKSISSTSLVIRETKSPLFSFVKEYNDILVILEYASFRKSLDIPVRIGIRTQYANNEIKSNKRVMKTKNKHISIKVHAGPFIEICSCR